MQYLVQSKWSTMFSLTYSLNVLVFCCVTIAYSACPLSRMFVHNDKCYHISSDQRSWNDSMSMCRHLGGGLVEIDDQDEQTYLQSHTSKLNRMYWIGVSHLQTNMDWTWMFTNTTIGPDIFTNWRPGNPNNSTGHDDCGLMFPNGEWDDVVCSFISYYICEVDANTHTDSLVG